VKEIGRLRLAVPLARKWDMRRDVAVVKLAVDCVDADDKPEKV
jgi:hypothetical protein